MSHKKRFSSVLALVATILLLNGCYYDIEEDLYPPVGNCDTAGVTYSGTVVPLLQAQCVTCHGVDLASGNIKLDTYSSVKTVVDNGKLYGSISFSSGYSAMPKGGNKLNNCSIIKIKAWIDAGAPNN